MAWVWPLILLLFAFVFPVWLGCIRWGLPRPYFWRRRCHRPLDDAGWGWFADYVWIAFFVIVGLLLISFF